MIGRKGGEMWMLLSGVGSNEWMDDEDEDEDHSQDSGENIVTKPGYFAWISFG